MGITILLLAEIVSTKSTPPAWLTINKINIKTHAQKLHDHKNWLYNRQLFCLTEHRLWKTSKVLNFYTSFESNRKMGLYSLYMKGPEFELLYNCSFYSVDDVPLEKRLHPVFSYIVMFLGIFFEVPLKYCKKPFFFSFFTSLALMHCLAKSFFSQISATNWCLWWPFMIWSY